MQQPSMLCKRVEEGCGDGVHILININIHISERPQAVATAKPRKQRKQAMAESKVATDNPSFDDSYIPQPLVHKEYVFGLGLILYLLATCWPPLILVATYCIWRVVGYTYRTNDDATTRRMLLDEFEKSDKAERDLLEFPSDVHIEEGYWTNSRGMLLHTTTMTPKNHQIKAVICHCHGYAENACYMKKKVLCKLVQQGIAVCMVDYEGHGRSDGELVLIKDFGLLVNDAAVYFQELIKKNFPSSKAFLLGESMGGAVAYRIYQEHPAAFAGVVFLCPMCKIADEMLPPEWVIQLGQAIAGPTGTATVIGNLCISPARGDLRLLAFKLAEKRAVFTRTPSIFGRYPRLATARELILTTKNITASLKDFDAPFLVQHGKADKVTDPLFSQALYDESKSKDKTIRLHDGMWHSLLNGEPDEHCDLVLQETIDWILERSVDKERKEQ